jgi:hypothetical protein
MVDRRIDQPMFGLGNQPNRPHHLLLCWLAAAEPVAGEGMPIPPDVPTSRVALPLSRAAGSVYSRRVNLLAAVDQALCIASLDRLIQRAAFSG